MLFVVLTWIYSLLIYPNLIEPMLKGRGKNTTPDANVQLNRQAREIQRNAESSMRTDFTATNYGKPLMQRMSVYIPGRGQFDDSFSIEDEQSKFLGECGAGISEVIGTGGNVTAVEAWLFDKDDFVRTITHVFASEHAYNDPGIRSKLDPKGPVILVKPGATTILETASLRLQARIIEAEYGGGALPPNSYFEKLTIELAAWRKDGAAAQAVPQPVAAAPIATPAPLPRFDSPASPPPLTVQPQTAPPPLAPPPPLGGGFAPRPFTPPSAPPSIQPPVDDDPFGGTGDFKPVR